jgi:23S rRNA (cytosine1962-C5)-methyltransferase
MNHPVLVLKPKKEKAILNRHPWIFSGAMEKRPKAKEGDIVAVKDVAGNTLGFGFYSEKSQISCRMFDWNSEARDFESVSYWEEKIRQALALRRSVIPENTNCFRLLYAEGDFFPGIIADVYNEVLVVQILIKGAEKIQGTIFDAFERSGFKNIYVKSKTSSLVLEDVRTDADWVRGSYPSPVEVKEHDLKFRIDFIEGQKTGFFLDQRENRNLLKNYCRDKIVLNAFSYTGGFSVYAMAGGAKEVHSLDISKDAVKGAEENMKINFPSANHRGIAEDCFEFLKNMEKDYYDVIVLDPPAFAKSAKAVDNAARGYKQINMRAFQKIKPEGILFTFSCSQNIDKDIFQKIIFGAAADAKRNVRIIHQLHQPADHPVSIFHPEGEYLKGLGLWVE